VTTFAAIDFDRYHQDDLAALLPSRRALVLAATQGLGNLALRVSDGGAFTYRRRDGEFEIVRGDDTADTVLELDRQSWQGLVHELEAPAGLLYAGRVRCRRGRAIDLMAWEPGLRALYNGRAPYDPARLDLRDRRGHPLDVERIFVSGDDRGDMAHFLRAARGVFRGEEIAAFRSEADALRDEARKGDHLSWWGKNAAGDEVLCRVTRAATKPHLATLPNDTRIVALKDLAGVDLVHRRGESDGVTVIYKNPDMVEGLGDIPWHRDCGMGGHAVMCPTLVASVYLTAATPETGELRMLPGSRDASFNAHVARAASLAGASFRARPGDVSLHYSDTIHAAPPPTARGLDGYRVSAVVGYAPPDAAHHRGERSYNDVLHQRADGQIEHLVTVAERRRIGERGWTSD
jgi:hypothetical protein